MPPKTPFTTSSMRQLRNIVRCDTPVENRWSFPMNLIIRRILLQDRDARNRFKFLYCSNMNKSTEYRKSVNRRQDAPRSEKNLNCLCVTRSCLTVRIWSIQPRPGQKFHPTVRAHHSLGPVSNGAVLSKPKLYLQSGLHEH